MATTGWSDGGVAPVQYPKEVVEIVQRLADTGTQLEALFPILQAGAASVEAAAIVLANPAYAAVDAALQLAQDALNSLSTLNIKFIVVTDPPIIGKMLSNPGGPTTPTNFEAEQASVTAEKKALKADVQAYMNLLSLQGSLNAQQQARANSLSANIDAAFASSGKTTPVLLGTQLAESIRDKYDSNRPGAEGQTAAAGLIAAAYGDASSVQALMDLVVFIRLLFGGQPDAATTAPSDGRLPTPSNLVIINTGGTGQFVPGLRWTNDPLLETNIFTTVDITYTLSGVYVERSVDYDESSWAEVTRLSPQYTAQVTGDTFPPKRTTPLASSLVDRTLNADARFAAYRVVYEFLDFDGNVVRNYVTGRVNSNARPAVSSTVGAPPNWRALGWQVAPAEVSTTLTTLRLELAASQDLATAGLKESGALVQKKIAKLQRNVTKVNQLLNKLRVLTQAQAASAAFKWQAFEYTGITEHLRTYDNIRGATSATPFAALKAAQDTTPLMQRMANDIEQSFASLPAAATTVSGGMAVAIVSDSAAAASVIKAIGALLNLSLDLAGAFQQLESLIASGKDQGVNYYNALKATWGIDPEATPVGTNDKAETVAAASDPLVFSDLNDNSTPAIPNPNVSLGEADAALNIAPEAGSYTRPLVGETDSLTADLNCPPGE